jgi:SpoVK/Ycf46/Vps4 family AAA+-type ATPase
LGFGGTSAETESAESRLDLASVAARTEGFSGADLRGILSDAALFAERRGPDERETREDVRRATELARASVSAHERRRLESIYAAFAGATRDDDAVAKKIAHA